MGQPKDMICCDCAGFDVEWMYRCDKHGTWRCRGCDCTYCIEDEMDDYEEGGPMDLEDQLDRALDAAFPSAKACDAK